MRRALARTFVAAALLASPLKAQEDVPCATGEGGGEMDVLMTVPGPDGAPVIAPIKIGDTKAVFDYVKHTLCQTFTPAEGVTITPAQQCFSMDTMKPLTDDKIIATMPNGHVFAMRPRLDVMAEDYDNNRLACKGAKFETPAVKL